MCMENVVSNHTNVHNLSPVQEDSKLTDFVSSPVEVVIASDSELSDNSGTTLFTLSSK